MDSLLWLAHRLGPVLTARYLTRNLLRMLALCYADETSLNLADPGQESSPFQISGALLQGDFNANRILGCLASIASLYGEQFVMLQYFPHAAEVVSRCIGSGTISVMLEGGLIGSCSLILASIPCLQVLFIKKRTFKWINLSYGVRYFASRIATLCIAFGKLFCANCWIL